MSTSRSRRGGVPWLLMVGIAAAGVYAVARSAPDTTSIGRATREFEASLVRIPIKIESVRDDLRNRFASAKVAFYSARAESEQALVSQLQEAKVRGSLPPL